YDALGPDDKAAFKDRLFTEILRVEPLELETRNALLDELADFADSIRRRRAPRVDGAAGRDAVAVAEAVLAQIRDHQWPGHAAGPVGPLALPEVPILRGPHWHAAPDPRPARREAG